MKKIYLFLAKRYIKCRTKDQRAVRICFVGKRLAVKHYNWLHFNPHPWDDKRAE